MSTMGPGDAGALVHGAGRKAALVDQHQDRLDALGAQLRHQRVHRLGLVLELQAGHAGRRHDARRGLEREADEAHRHAAVALDGIGRQQRLAGGGVDGAGGQVLETRAGEGRGALAAVMRVATAALQAQQLGRALVELVVAHGGQVQPHQAQRFDGGLVMEQGREQRAGAHQVARGHHDHVRRLRLERLHRAGQVLGTARGQRNARARNARVADAEAAGRWLQVPVEIVEGQDLQRDHRRVGRRRAAGGHGDERRRSTSPPGAAHQ
jgi:hypothetical protein